MNRIQKIAIAAKVLLLSWELPRLLVSWLAFSLLVGLAAGAEYPYAVRVGGASGVNVHPSGLVLTVKHVEAPPNCPIAFPSGETYTGTRVYTTSEDDGPDVFRLANVSTALPYVKLAPGVPQLGDAATAIGYPVNSTLTTRSGKLTGGDYSQAWNGRRFLKRLLVNRFDFPTYNGMSGGPVVNGKGELIGLIHASDERAESWHIGWTATKQAIDTAMRKPTPIAADKKTLYVFTSSPCAPCEAWKRDFTDGIDGIGIEFVTWTGSGWSNAGIALEMQRTVQTPFPGEIPTPTFWIGGCTKSASGYTAGQRTTFLRWLFGCGCWNRPAPAPQPPPQPLPAPQPLPPIPPTPDLGEPQPPLPDLSGLEEDIENLRLEIAALKLREGPQGPAGPIGPQGPPGKPGANADINALIARISKIEARPITMRLRGPGPDDVFEYTFLPDGKRVKLSELTAEQRANRYIIELELVERK